jgi:hypothetical protein
MKYFFKLACIFWFLYYFSSTTGFFWIWMIEAAALVQHLKYWIIMHSQTSQLSSVKMGLDKQSYTSPSFTLNFLTLSHSRLLQLNIRNIHRIYWIMYFRSLLLNLLQCIPNIRTYYKQKRKRINNYKYISEISKGKIARFRF